MYVNDSWYDSLDGRYLYGSAFLKLKVWQGPKVGWKIDVQTCSLREDQFSTTSHPFVKVPSIDSFLGFNILLARLVKLTSGFFVMHSMTRSLNVFPTKEPWTTSSLHSQIWQKSVLAQGLQQSPPSNPHSEKWWVNGIIDIGSYCLCLS